MKFHCCVILKKEPFHTMCVGEADAIAVIEREKDNVVLVLFAENGMHRQIYETQARLVERPQGQLQTREVNEINAIPDDTVKEITDEIDKAIDANFQ